MSTNSVDVPASAPSMVRTADVTLKAMLLMMLAVTLVSPEWANLEGKAAGARAVSYPLLAFAIPAIWWTYWRERGPLPWLPSLLVSITCFSDILGNRLDLYDRVVWFDDWMHFINLAFLAAAVVLLTLHRSSGLVQVLERALAFGATAAIIWEIGEYFAFISGSSARHFAYADTLSDLGLGVVGAVVGGVVVHRLWAAGALVDTAPQLDLAHADRLLRGAARSERPIVT